MYDFENDKIQTHAKAYFLNGNFDVTVFDNNEELALKVSQKYGFKLIIELNEIDLNKYDCISICSPTFTHFKYLKMCFNSNIPLVICEKPVDLNLNNLIELKKIHQNSTTKVLVNYTRRFQKAFEILKNEIHLILETDKLRNIHINYHRGFLNNCSHAFDILEFLFDKEIELENIIINESQFDVFEDDPTISMYSKWENSIITTKGLIDIKYPIFEIYLYFDYYYIKILESGNDIEIQNKHTDLKKSPNSKTIKDGLVNFMESVIENAYLILNGEIQKDNFDRSVELAEKMIKYLKC